MCIRDRDIHSGPGADRGDGALSQIVQRRLHPRLLRLLPQRLFQRLRQNSLYDGEQHILRLRRASPRHLDTERHRGSEPLLRRIRGAARLAADDRFQPLVFEKRPLEKRQVGLPPSYFKGADAGRLLMGQKRRRMPSTRLSSCLLYTSSSAS